MIELLLEAERALSMGRADRAEVLYQQVVASDPRNSIAVVGLARVALERADDAGALVLARRALAIDGENVAAQRLVQRLEEVLQTRGEALPAPEAEPPLAAAPPHVAAPPPVADPADDDIAAAWAAAARAGPWAAPATPPTDDDPGASAEAAPPPPRPTPFDGPDPVLGPAQRGAGTPATGTGDAGPARRARRSLLDRLRGR